MLFSVFAWLWGVWLAQSTWVPYSWFNLELHNSNVKIWKVLTHSDKVALPVTCEKMIRSNMNWNARCKLALLLFLKDSFPLAIVMYRFGLIPGNFQEKINQWNFVSEKTKKFSITWLTTYMYKCVYTHLNDWKWAGRKTLLNIFRNTLGKARFWENIHIWNMHLTYKFLASWYSGCQPIFHRIFKP